MKRSHLISRLDLAVLIGITLSILLANIAVFGQECETLRTEVVRLHILANSDNDFDQEIKLKVRDRILADVGGIFASPQSQQDAKAAAQEHLEDIKHAAQAELHDNGINAPVRVELCNMYFSTRRYGSLYLPAGDYDAVRVTIGAGAGRNWWCVMYPPLCVSAALAEQTPEMDEIEHLNGEPLFKPKLAIVELFENIFKRSSP